MFHVRLAELRSQQLGEQRSHYPLNKVVQLLWQCKSWQMKEGQSRRELERNSWLCQGQVEARLSPSKRDAFTIHGSHSCHKQMQSGLQTHKKLVDSWATTLKPTSILTFFPWGLKFYRDVRCENSPGLILARKVELSWSDPYLVQASPSSMLNTCQLNWNSPSQNTERKATIKAV